ncbi:nicotinamide N-methyltransferase-like [Ornithodoros turicata]|uniref:nicotinamide N-methyltransferase-like n=1 Tax=Ornithodoros turicata TaxID=34597 RepID=UPI00313871F3
MNCEEVKEQYRRDFDPVLYQAAVKSKDFLHLFYQQQLHHIFDGDLIAGETLIDVGCGPTAHSLFPVTKRFSGIVQCELLEKNRAAVLRWLNKDPEMLDWSFFAESEARLEGYEDVRAGAEEIQERTRKAIKHVVPCDVYDPTVLPEEHRIEYDVVLTVLCLEAAAPDLAAYNQASFNIYQLVKTGGFLVQCGVLGATSYRVGKTAFRAMCLAEDMVKSAIETTGFKIKRWTVDEPRIVEGYVYNGAYVLVAEKCC